MLCSNCCCCYGACSKIPTFHFCCFKFPLRTGCFILGTFRILLWIVCIVLACYHHLNTELESGPRTFVSLVTVVAFPISMFIFDSLMLVAIFLRRSKPLLLWIYFNVLASIFPYVISLNENFSDYYQLIERLALCALITLPSVYAILVVFSYYRELSQSRGLVLRDPRMEDVEFFWASPSAANIRTVDVYLSSHYRPTAPSKYDFV